VFGVAIVGVLLLQVLADVSTCVDIRMLLLHNMYQAFQQKQHNIAHTSVRGGVRGGVEVVRRADGAQRRGVDVGGVGLSVVGVLVAGRAVSVR